MHICDGVAATLNYSTDPHPSPVGVELFQSKVRTIMEKTIHKNSSNLLQQMLETHFDAPGKMIRPLLAFQLGLLRPICFDQLAAWAASCELLHNATIIHDDLQDRDTVRRGQRSLWARYGERQAINAGDFLLLVALQPILESDIPPETKNILLLQFSQMACKIANGQNLEFELNEAKSGSGLYESYLECISLKTGALFSDVACGTNALMPTPFADDNYIRNLFGKIGNLFQIFDDLIDLYGQKKRDQPGCDIKEGKVSFLMAIHIQNHPHDFNQIMDILKKPREQTNAHDIYTVSRLYQSKNTVDACLQKVRSLNAEIMDLVSQHESKQLRSTVTGLTRMILSQPLVVESVRPC